MSNPHMSFGDKETARKIDEAHTTEDKIFAVSNAWTDINTPKFIQMRDQFFYEMSQNGIPHDLAYEEFKNAMEAMI